MWFFIARRVLYAVPILFGVSFVVFLLMKMVPGDAADIMIPPEAPKEVAAMKSARRVWPPEVRLRQLDCLDAAAESLDSWPQQPVVGSDQHIAPS